MADTPTTQANDSEVLSQPLNTDLGKLPGFLQKQQKAGNEAVKAKVEAETAKTEADLGAKREALEKIGAEDKAHYEEVKKEMKPVPEFKPTQDNAMDLGAIFSMIGTMGVALGGSGKLSGLNALNAMGGMLKGYQQGRKDLFAKEQATFDKEMASIKSANDALLKDLEQYQKLRVTDKEAALLKAGEIAAKNPGVIASLINSGQADNALEIAKANTKLQSEIMAKAAKTGISGQGMGMSDFFPGLSLAGTKSQNEDKKNSINAGALSLATADDLKQYARDNPQYLGRQGQVAQNVDRYLKSWEASGGTADINSMPDDGQPALIFAKKYAAYLVGYERTLAGSNRGMTQQFQARFNNLMSQDQFNAAGFEQLMNEQMNEVARATVAKDPAITGSNLYAYGKNIFKRAELPITSQTTATPRVASKADIAATAKGQNITEEEAKKRLKAAGFQIEGE
jgi:hypothetical protein